MRFYQLPLVARIACALTFLNTWVLIAEFVIDRYALDRYLPFYRHGNICPWDILILLLVGSLTWRASLPPKA